MVKVFFVAPFIRIFVLPFLRNLQKVLYLFLEEYIIFRFQAIFNFFFNFIDTSL